MKDDLQKKLQNKRKNSKNIENVSRETFPVVFPFFLCYYIFSIEKEEAFWEEQLR